MPNQCKLELSKLDHRTQIPLWDCGVLQVKASKLGSKHNGELLKVTIPANLLASPAVFPSRKTVDPRTNLEPVVNPHRKYHPRDARIPAKGLINHLRKYDQGAPQFDPHSLPQYFLCSHNHRIACQLQGLKSERRLEKAQSGTKSLGRLFRAVSQEFALDLG